MTVADKKRDTYLDCVKGTLILLVIIGHYLPGTLSESFARHVIYSFHMPVFFMLSGYLFNITRAIETPFIKNISRYIIRFLPPWIFATTVYFFLNCISGEEIVSVGRYIRQYLNPYYHLWYILGFLFCIIITLIYLKFAKQCIPAIMRGGVFVKLSSITDSFKRFSYY